jgi:4-hydroxy-3-methylbut-2-enyl diphosphate reductase
MGVRRAVELALEAVHQRSGPIYSYGPLIHNPQAVGLLASKGLTAAAADPEALDGLEPGAIIIRAHGIPPSERSAMRRAGFEVIDATCPRVIRVQAIIQRHAGQGYTPIIWGNADHPEVRGLLGYADGRGRVISGPENAAGLPPAERVILVAQTTQEKARFPQVAEAIRARWPEALVFDTICGATERRQDDVRRLADQVDAVVVVGGHASGNTKRLAEVAAERGARVIQVETEDEIDPDTLAGHGSVGVTAGASTPNWMIKRVLRYLESTGRKRRVTLWSLAQRGLRYLVLSNLYAAFGAGGLCLAGAILQRIPPRPAFFGVTFFYVFAMHVLNLFLDKEASQYNDPDRVYFLEKRKHFLLFTGVFSAATALALGGWLGPAVLGLLAVMSALGLLYAVPLLPPRLARRVGFRRLKDIPVSKTLSLSGGWAVCLSLVPALAPSGGLSAATVVVAALIFCMVFFRSALGDIMDIQGDRIAGRETLPIIIGESKTLKLVGFLPAVMAGLLTAGGASGWLSPAAWWLLPTPFFAAFCFFVFRGDRVTGSANFEALVDANFILAGLLAGLAIVIP